MPRLVFVVALAGLLPLCGTGCPANTRTVRYSKAGEGQCPQCKSVLPHRAVRCTVCETPLRWNAAISPCWHCDGSGLCQVCNGHGLVGTDALDRTDCFACKGAATKCPHCNGEGLVEHGGS